MKHAKLMCKYANAGQMYILFRIYVRGVDINHIMHADISLTYFSMQVYLASVRTFFYPHSGLKILLMCISLLLSLLIGLSRISDNRHHPSDVLSGFVLGGLVAVGIVSKTAI